MMNFGDGEAHIVEFSPALPNQGAFFLRTNQQGSCWNQYRVRVRTVRVLSQMICWWCSNPMRNSPSRTSRVNLEACQTYATWRLGTSSKASDQSARVSPEIVVSVGPSVRCFM